MSQTDPLSRGQVEDPSGDPEFRPLGAGFDFADPNSPLAPYYLRASHLVAVALLAVVFVFVTYVPLWHTDVWGHLKFGQWIVENGCLPKEEPFCPHATYRAECIDYCWLSQSGFYLIYHAGEWLAGGKGLLRMEGGVALLRTTHALLLVLRCVLLLLAFRRLTRSLPLACLGVVFVLLIGIGHVAILRPQVVGEVLLAGLLFLLSRPVLSRTALVAVPLLMVVWANAHGSYSAGLLLLGGCLAGRAISACRSARSWDPRRAWADVQVSRLAWALLFSLVAIAVLNPHGPKLFWQTLQMTRHPNVVAMDEWQPLAWSPSEGGFWFYLVSLLLLAGTQLFSPQWYSPTQLILILTFGIQPCLHQRMMVWWLMLVPWLILPHWAVIRGRLSWSWLEHESVPSFRKTLLAGMLMVVALCWSTPGQWLISGGPWPLQGAVSEGTPWRLAAQLTRPQDARAGWLPALGQWLKAHYLQGRYAGTIFASETQGDYLLWALPARMPLFVYAHVHLFTPEHWEECATVKRGEPGWRAVLDRHRINLVVVEPELHPSLRVALWRDPAWQVVLDETGSSAKWNKRGRLLVALRKTPR
jgi:hypothetical protein